MSDPSAATGPWYRGVTRYQWVVLIIASLGWVFDVFEGQIFVASMQEAMPSLVPAQTSEGTIALYNNVALGAFLLGGALGGILFGMLSDRVGRKRTMTYTILMYSLFTCVSAVSQEWWHLAGFRFLVALGVGGEWAVASALVAEVFPQRARAWSLGIFHASSVFGTWLAVLAATFLIGNEAVLEWAQAPALPVLGSLTWIEHYVELESLPWRIGFVLGVLPAVLIIWIRLSLREPENWEEARRQALADPLNQQLGAISHLFAGPLLRNTLVGVTLAGVGLATFWGVHIYGKNVFQKAAEQRIVAEAAAEPQPAAERRAEILVREKARVKRWEMLGMFLVTAGGGLGLVSFGPVCERLGRRGAFLLYHLGGLASALWLFHTPMPLELLACALPVFGFLTLGMHAGYAIYFPELYPTRLRGTGAGFCFNAGRLLVPPVLVLIGWLRKDWGYSLEEAASLLSGLFLVGAAVLLFAPETRGRELPR